MAGFPAGMALIGGEWGGVGLWQLRKVPVLIRLQPAVRQPECPKTSGCRFDSLAGHTHEGMSLVLEKR